MHYALNDLEGPLCAALRQLRTADDRRRPCVVVEEVITKKFVQFAGSRKEMLVLDVPDRQITHNKGAYFFFVEDFTLVHYPVREDPAQPQQHPTWQKRGFTPEEGTRLAVQVLREVLEFDEIPEARFEIQEVGAEKN